MSTEEQKSFLNGPDEGHYDSLLGSASVISKTDGKRLLWSSLIVNVVLLVVCSLLSITVVSLSSFQGSRTSGQNVREGQIAEPYSPANAIIEYEYRSIINDTRFVGAPSAEWELLMHELLEGTLIRVSEDELKFHGSKSIPLKDGGYAAGLGVAHNLHCVRKIKKLLYREHFYPDLGPDSGDFKYIQSHADHCLDYLRQSIMCNLDYTMYTLYWGERRQDIPTHNAPGMQKCVSWDKLHQWMLGRAANADMLMGP